MCPPPSQRQSLFTQRTFMIIVGAVAVTVVSAVVAFIATDSAAVATLIGMGSFFACLHKLNDLVE
jgi:hypothetical protein